MIPFADAIVLVWLAAHGGAAAKDATAAGESLRTFVVAKPDVARHDEGDGEVRAPEAAAQPPLSAGRIGGLVGIGYVQHADWGAEVMAAGTASRLSLQLDALVTYGSQGARFDRGTLSLADDDRGWRADAGDLFSDLRGPVRGARFTLNVGDRWQPGVSLDGPRPGAIDRRTMLVYRDRLRVGPVWLDGELAVDGSHFIRSRVAAGRFDVEASYRRAREPVPQRDAGANVGVRLWHGLAVAAGTFRSDRSGDRSEWHTVAVHVPVHRYFGVTVERAFSRTSGLADSMSAVMVDVHAGRLMFFHRYQWGRADYATPGLGMLDRQQLQSMASFTAGPRLNVTLQMASQWVAAGRAQNWLELQTDVRLARRTNLHVATPLPGAFAADLVRVRIEQGLPGRFSVFGEYGRPSSFQTMADGTETPRFLVMLRRSWDVTTPAAGGQVRGLVLDYIGRPVPGVRVRLGPYSADTDAEGAYAFVRVPRGEFALSLDPDLLPADYAWDGRSRHLFVTPSSRVTSDLVVAPLNAIHGRVFADRNANGRFDPGEGVAGAVLHLADHVTATNTDGAYDFYNVLPGPHVIRLDTARLPAAFEAPSRDAIEVTLPEDRPVVGADFLVGAKARPVIWREVR